VVQQANVWLDGWMARQELDAGMLLFCSELVQVDSDSDSVLTWEKDSGTHALAAWQKIDAAFAYSMPWSDATRTCFFRLKLELDEFSWYIDENTEIDFV
jgi:hypothetical protein